MFNWRKRQPDSQSPDSDQVLLKLSELRPGEKGIILEVGGTEQFRFRLIEMGLTKDSEVSVDKYAPLLDPMELIIKGYHLSIRAKDADEIVVKRIV